MRFFSGKEGQKQLGSEVASCKIRILRQGVLVCRTESEILQEPRVPEEAILLAGRYDKPGVCRVLYTATEIALTSWLEVAERSEEGVT